MLDERLGRDLALRLRDSEVHERTLGLDERSDVMVTSWWFLWATFLVVFVVPLVGYGWGIRGWGPPYPRYVQDWRHRRAGGSAGDAFDHRAWGGRGDFVWLAIVTSALLVLVLAFGH